MVYCEWRRPRCAVGMLSVFGPPMEGRARAAMQFLSRLKDVLWWWRVEPVLSCWMCPGRGFCVDRGVVCRELQWWTAASMALLMLFPSLSAGFVVVLRLCGPSQGGAQLSTDLRHRPIGVV